MEKTISSHITIKYAFRNSKNELSRSEGGTGSAVYQSGPEGKLRSKIVEIVNGAREHLCICSFLLSDPEIEKAIIKASKDRRVRVYLLTAAETLLDADDEDEQFKQERSKSQKDMLRRFIGKVYLRSARHYHAKYIIADSVNGMMTTCNFTTKALMENPEFGVLLGQEQCEELRKEFIYQFWECAELESMTLGTMEGVSRESRFQSNVPKGDLRLSFHDEKANSTILAECLDIIDSAEDSVIATSYGWGNKEIADKLISRAKAGVKVTIVGRNHRGLGQTKHLQKFRDSGCDVLGLPWIHAKCVIGDIQTSSPRIMIMSANLDEYLTSGNSHDIGLVIPPAEASRVKTIVEQWLHSSLQMVPKDELKSVEGELKVAKEGADPLWQNLTVVNETQIDHGTIQAKSAEKAEKTKPQLKVPSQQGLAYRNVKHTWTVEIPTLAPKAKEEEWAKAPAEDGKGKNKGAKHTERVFVEPDGTRVIGIESIDDADRAAKYLKKAKAKRVVLIS